MIFAAAAAYMAHASSSDQQSPEIYSGKNITSESSVEEWLEMAESADHEDEAFRLLEAAHRRFPSNADVAEKLTDQYREEAETSNKLDVRREATLGFQRVVGRFRDTCPPESLDLALRLEEEATRLASELEEDLRNQRRVQTENVLEELEQAVENLGGSGADSEEKLDEIEKIDDEIDPEILSQHEDLKERYDQVTEEISRRFTNHSQGVRDRRYNKKAVEAADEAWEMYKSKRSDWTEKVKETARRWSPSDSKTPKIESSREHNIELFANVIGGWESHRLLPAVNKYLSSVRSDIFEDLDREGRRIFTEKIIEAPPKDSSTEE